MITLVILYVGFLFGYGVMFALSRVKRWYLRANQSASVTSAYGALVSNGGPKRIA